MFDSKYSLTLSSERVIAQPAAERSADASDNSNACSTVSLFSISCKSISRIRPENSLILPFFSTVSRRSEEHTSELQSRPHLVCRLLLEKKKKKKKNNKNIKKKKKKQTKKKKR